MFRQLHGLRRSVDEYRRGRPRRRRGFLPNATGPIDERIGKDADVTPRIRRAEGSRTSARTATPASANRVPTLRPILPVAPINNTKVRSSLGCFDSSGT